MKTNYLTVESPDQTATVDFLNVNASVSITHNRETNTLEIKVTVLDSEESSYFTEHEFSAPLTED